MRVVTLLPAATEIVAAIGAGDELVGISHECDWPPKVQQVPRVTTTPIDRDAPSGAIDQAVRAAMQQGRPVIAVDGDQLRELEPELIITQGLCEVCAVDNGQAYRLAEAMPVAPGVISLRARTIEGIHDDIRLTGTMLGRETEAERLIGEMVTRLADVAGQVSMPPKRVVCIEWLEPAYLAGHWVPELVAAAGGIDIGATTGSHSIVRPWSEIIALDPDVVVVMLCGMDLPRAMREIDAVRDPVVLAFFASRPVWVLDGNAYTSRPGPRVVDGAVRIQSALAGREMDGLVLYLSH